MRTRLALPLLAVAALALAACGSDASTGSGGGSDTADAITVTSTADACTLSATSAAAGAVTFEITNDGSEATEFYVYGADGETVVAEVENIGPGITQDLTATLESGAYITACKPGMVGEGIRGPFTVS